MQNQARKTRQKQMSLIAFLDAVSLFFTVCANMKLRTGIWGLFACLIQVLDSYVNFTPSLIKTASNKVCYTVYANMKSHEFGESFDPVYGQAGT